MSRLLYVRGLPFSKAPWYTVENAESVLDYVPRDGDVVLMSYPKTGVTWLQYIVLQIISKGELLPSFGEAFLKHVPLMEYAGASVIDKLEGIRTYRTHIPYDRMQKNSRAKYLYIYRKPEDQFLSEYKFLSKIRSGQVHYDEFIEQYLSGEIEYGRYFEHILAVLEHKDDENLLMISYEKMYVDRKNCILKIAKFLGDEYFQTLTTDPITLDQILEHTSFEYMQKNFPFEHPVLKIEGDAFFRKGIIGEGKLSLPPDDVKRILQLAQEVMKGTEILQEWLQHWEKID